MKKLKIILLILFALFIPLNTALAFTIPDRPQNGFYDPDNYISIETKNKLIEFNEKYKESDHTQLGIAIVSSLEGNYIENISKKIATKWQIGYENSNHAALLLISINDRKFRIETSNELGKIITDNEALEILNSTKSEMRNHNYDAAVQSIISKIDNEITKEATEPNNPEGANNLFSYLNQNNIFKYLMIAPFLAFATLVLKIKFENRIEENRLEKYKEKCLKRSQFYYNGDDKLYPDDTEFNSSGWTESQISNYEEEKQKEYSKRSDYNYKGHDKLRPGDENFNDTMWTQNQILMYYAMISSGNNSLSSSHSSHSSSSSSSSSDSSSWSSSSWSGNGFDGGGSSSSW